MYDKPIRILFTKVELEKQNNFKKFSGMTLNAIADQAIDFFLNNPILAQTREIVPKKEEKTFKERKISPTVYKRLLSFCDEKEGRNISTTAATAISIFIDLHNT